MSELTYTIVRFGLLALLWLFVLSLAAVLRRDIYGTQISRRTLRERRRALDAAPREPVAAAPRPPDGTFGAAPAQAPPATAARGKRQRIPTRLVVTEGRLAGTSVPLGRQGVLIGRGPECTLVLDDEFASSRHARVFPRAEGWFVEDQGSRNGTTVGGHPITGLVPVEAGAVIRIGRTTLELQD